MNQQAYEVFKPKVGLRTFWLEGLLLTVSFVTPLLAWLIWKDGDIVSRSGSLMVFFAATAEFVSLNKANRKHILNACRARANENPWDFSKTDKVVGVISLILAFLGTFIWGFGDLYVGT